MNDPGHIDWYPANDTVERFVYDLGGWPTPQVERRRMERLRALIAEAVAAERERIRAAVEANLLQRSSPRGWYCGFCGLYETHAPGCKVAAVLAIIDRENKG